MINTLIKRSFGCFALLGCLAFLVTYGSASKIAQAQAKPSPIQNIRQLAAGGGHTCLLTNTGGVQCWGDNSYGQLGAGTFLGKSTPVDVIGLSSSDVTALALGGSLTCALTSKGGVKCWGDGDSGQLGNGVIESSTPVDIDGLSSGVIALAVGASHVCALTSGGGVQCWGNNSDGQLGDGTFVGKSSGVTALAASSNRTCVLIDGGVKCWGGSPLGDGTAESSNVPVDVIGLSRGVTALATSYEHTCALTERGSVKCWGSNYAGQLGDGTFASKNIPVNVSGLQSDVVAIVVGDRHACALTSDGGVKCWGDNGYGQLGDSTIESQNIPVDVDGLNSGVTALAAGGKHTCALMSAGGVKCWGYNAFGQLGNGTPVYPADVSGLNSGISALVAGGRHTCALMSAGGVKCWGYNGFGQLGDGTFRDKNTPADVYGLNNDVTALAVGHSHTCVLTNRGGVKCWGYSNQRQPSGGLWQNENVPVDVNGLSNDVAAITTGGSHTCALNHIGGVKCWGYNRSGQLGDGTTAYQNIPTDVQGLTSGVTSIAAGASHTCALTSSGGVKCWGNNEFGQLGDGTWQNESMPVDVNGLSSGVTAIAARASHTCALTCSGGIKCWGGNGYGQLGDGTTENQNVPVDVTGLSSNVVALATGISHTCALNHMGSVKCWGNNYSGQLGDGTTENQNIPVDVGGLNSGVTALAAGGSHTCAITSNGGVKCWGANYAGQLGDGSAWRTTPVDVLMVVGQMYLPVIQK